jgi:hypothetical protein
MEQTSGRLVKLGLGVQCFSLKDTATLGGRELWNRNAGI